MAAKNRMTLVNPKGKTAKEVADLLMEALGLNDESKPEDEATQ